MALAIHDRFLHRLCFEVKVPTLMLQAHTYIAHSVKMVGLFVTSLVGLYTIEDLWDKFGDVKMSWVSLLANVIHQRVTAV